MDAVAAASAVAAAPVESPAFKKPRTPGRDRTMECIVCGKQFPRGQLDLNRHVHAVTLNHLASKHHSDAFPFPCPRCGWNFTKQEHLDIHRSHSACAKSVNPFQSSGGYLFLSSDPIDGSLTEVDEHGQPVDHTYSPTQVVHSPPHSVYPPSAPSAYASSPLAHHQQHQQHQHQHQMSPPQPTLSTIEFPHNATHQIHPLHSPAVLGYATSVPSSHDAPSAFMVHTSGPMMVTSPGSGAPMMSSPLMGVHLPLSSAPITSHMMSIAYMGSPSAPSTGLSLDGAQLTPGSMPMTLSSLAHHHDSSRTMECMICGKLFPRGPIDLQRHATAITLKHLVSSKPSPGFSFSCARCSLCFTTAEHLQMHSTMSTCNTDMVWPDNAGSTSGLRTVTRAQAAIQAANAAALAAANPPPPAPPVPEKPPAAKRSKSDAKRPASEGAQGPATKKRSGSVVKEPLVAGGQPASLGSRIDQLVASLVAPSNSIFPHAGELPARSKRTKVIIPEERKAYFALISLLVDPKKVGPTVKLSDENYEQFLAPEHRAIVEKLKGMLLHTC